VTEQEVKDRLALELPMSAVFAVAITRREIGRGQSLEGNILSWGRIVIEDGAFYTKADTRPLPVFSPNFTDAFVDVITRYAKWRKESHQAAMAVTQQHLQHEGPGSGLEGRAS
jgi:hypothetical protein